MAKEKAPVIPVCKGEYCCKRAIVNGYCRECNNKLEVNATLVEVKA